MEYIHLKVNAKGRKTIDAHMGGFEIEAPKSATILGDGFVCRRGELSKQFKVLVPYNQATLKDPNINTLGYGMFKIPDTQYNRERLRIITKEWKETVKIGGLNTMQYMGDMPDNREEKVIYHNPTIEVINGVPIDEDLEKPLGKVYTQEEVEAIISQVKSSTIDEVKPISKPKGRPKKIIEEEELKEA